MNLNSSLYNSESIKCQLNRETLLMERVYRVKSNMKNQLRIQWDKNQLPQRIKSIHKTTEHGVVSNKELNLAWDNKQVIHYEDNKGNYWDKKEFTIPNPYAKFQNDGLCYMGEVFEKYMEHLHKLIISQRKPYIEHQHLYMQLEKTRYLYEFPQNPNRWGVIQIRE